MRFLFCILLASVPLTAQTARPATAAKMLPPFSGTWVLNMQRSKLTRRIEGESKAIIQYDGKTWNYIHSHQDQPDEEPEAWRITLIVNSAKLHTEPGEEITFHSRIQQQGNAMLMSEWGQTQRGQRVRATTRYTLEDKGNTLIEAETSVGPLGPVKNLYILEREGTGSLAAAAK